MNYTARHRGNHSVARDRWIQISANDTHKKEEIMPSITILLDASIVIWNKKPDIHHNGCWAQFIEKKHWISIIILPEGFPVVWIKKYVTPKS